MGLRTSLVILSLVALAACRHSIRPQNSERHWRVACVDAGAQNMALAADVWDWDLQVMRATRAGEWVAEFDVSQTGLFRLQCVADGARRFPPVEVDVVEDDGFGGKNGVLYQAPSDSRGARSLE